VTTLVFARSGRHGIPRSEAFRAGGAEGDDARRGVARGPPLLHRTQQDRGPDAAAEMVAALAPIDAGATKRALVPPEEQHVDAAFLEKALAGSGQEDDIVAPP
jgi:hypothetical protein